LISHFVGNAAAAWFALAIRRARPAISAEGKHALPADHPVYSLNSPLPIGRISDAPVAGDFRAVEVTDWNGRRLDEDALREEINRRRHQRR
jgi:hypothetical protein